MRKNIIIPVTSVVEVVEKTIKYFQHSGFKLVENGNGKLKFTSGSLASTMWTFNPLKWKSEVRVEINEGQIIAEFNIDTTGQMVTNAEEKVWDEFIENYKRFIKENRADYFILMNEIVKANKKNSLKYLGWALVGGLIGGIPAEFIAYVTDIDAIAAMGTAGGVLVLLNKKINNEK